MSSVKQRKESNISVQPIVVGTRRPDSDSDYNAYVGIAGKLLFGAGGTINAQYDRLGQLAGDGGPEQVLVMDFPDEETVRGVFDSPEYQLGIPHRDAAFDVSASSPQPKPPRQRPSNRAVR
ncbi:MAG: DUF1330 domain-containing protein [bacterium]|nr:DUF1330 domain-containing protein [bacterium]